jgi:ATP-dependent DNA ligase
VEGDGGIADFQLIHSRKHDRRRYLIAFNLGDRDLRPLSLEMRKQLLAHLLHGSTSGIVYTEHFEGLAGATVFNAACKMGLGIVSKRKDKAYTSGPCKHWIKVRTRRGSAA